MDIGRNNHIRTHHFGNCLGKEIASLGFIVIASIALEFYVEDGNRSFSINCKMRVTAKETTWF